MDQSLGSLFSGQVVSIHEKAIGDDTIERKGRVVDGPLGSKGMPVIENIDGKTGKVIQPLGGNRALIQASCNNGCTGEFVVPADSCYPG